VTPHAIMNAKLNVNVHQLFDLLN